VCSVRACVFSIVRACVFSAWLVCFVPESSPVKPVASVRVCVRLCARAVCVCVCVCACVRACACACACLLPDSVPWVAHDATPVKMVTRIRPAQVLRRGREREREKERKRERQRQRQRQRRIQTEMQRERASEREIWRVGGFRSQGMWNVDSLRSSSILDEGSMDRRKSAG
jgi:hypothetical protein